MFNNDKQYKFSTTNSAHLIIRGLEETNQVTFGFSKEASTDKISYSPRNVYIAFGPVFMENRPILVLTQDQLNKLKEFINYVYKLDMLPDPYYNDPE